MSNFGSGSQPQWRKRSQNGNNSEQGRYNSNRRDHQRGDNDWGNGQRRRGEFKPRKNDWRRKDDEQGNERRSSWGGRRDDRNFNGRDRNERSGNWGNRNRGERGFTDRNRGERRFNGRQERDFDDRKRNYQRDNRHEQRRNDWERDEKTSGYNRTVRGLRRGYTQDQKIERRQLEPELPEAVSATDLDVEVLAELKSLSDENRDVVARHLVMAGSLIDIDPAQAWRHTEAAVSRAGRIGAVREAAALAAYANEDYTQALREVRAARRLSGSDNLRAIEADCERALGKPDKALEIIAATAVNKLPVSEQAEIALVNAGARGDQGLYDAALLVLDDFLVAHENLDDEITARLLEAQADFTEANGDPEAAAEIRERIPALPEPVMFVDVEEIVEAETKYVPTDLRGSRKELAAVYDTVLFDLDGVCWHGNRVEPAAVTTISQLDDFASQAVYITNNSSRTPEQIAQRLEDFGIPTDARHVMTSAIDGAELAKKLLPPQAKVLVVGGEGVIEALENAGFEVVFSAADHPAAVLQGWDPSVDWAKLSEAAYAIEAGAAYLLTNTDATIPTERGLSLGNGSMSRAVVNATGVEPRAAGKPFSSIFHNAVALVDGKKAISVGDRLDTDIAGARKAGVASLHVLTGVHKGRDVIFAEREQRPNFVGVDVSALLRAHPGAVKNPDGTWTAGNSASVVIDERGTILVDNEPLADAIDEDTYRAVLAAAWEALDNGKHVKAPEFKVFVANESDVDENHVEEATETEQAATTTAPAEVEEPAATEAE